MGCEFRVVVTGSGVALECVRWSVIARATGGAFHTQFLASSSPHDNASAQNTVINAKHANCRNTG